MSTQNATALAVPAPVPVPAAVRYAVRCGLPVALLSAAALSFQGLYTLARAVGWAALVAWLLPVSIDVAAAIATVVWLSSPVGYGVARRHAARTALISIGLSVAGNAAAHLIEGHILDVTPAVIVTVTSVPPIVVALLVHLGMTLPQPPPATTRDERPRQSSEAPAEPQTASMAPRRTIADAVAIATRMLEAEERAGRDPDRFTSPPLAAELGCTPSYARRILRIARQANPSVRTPQ